MAAERRPSVERSRPAATAAAFQDGHGGAYGAVGPLRGRPPSTAHYLQLTPAGCGQPLGPPPNVQVGGAWTGSGAGASTVEDGGGGAGAAGGRGISSCLAEDPPLAPCDTLHSRRHHPSTTYDHPVNGPTEARHRRRFVLKPSRPSAPASAWARRAMSDPYRWDVQVSRATSSRFTARGSSSRREAPPRPSVERTLLSTFPAQAATLSALKPTPLAAYVLPSRSADERSRSCAHLSAQQPRPRMRAASLRLQEGVVTDAGVRSPSPHLVVSSTPFMTFAPWLAPRLPGRLRRLTLRAASRWRACTRRNVL